MSAPIRVLVADDHPVVRSGVCSMLNRASDIIVVQEATTGPEAIRMVEKELPDVLLLDIELPGKSGIEVARELRDHPVRILALSSYDDPEYAAGLLESGAAGYLTKEKAPTLILEAVRAVHRGEVRWFVQPSRETDVLGALTLREKEVLRQLARGKSNQDLATSLGVSVHTIRTHVANIYAKLDIDSGRKAVAWAWQNGLMQHP